MHVDRSAPGGPTVSAGLSEDIAPGRSSRSCCRRTLRMRDRRVSTVDAVEQDLAALDPARWIRNQPKHRQRGDAFAGTGFADDRKRLRRDRHERNAIDRGHGSALGAEPRRQVFDLQQRRVIAASRSVAHLFLQILIDPDAGIDRARADGAGTQFTGVIFHPGPPGGEDVGRRQPDIGRLVDDIPG